MRNVADSQGPRVGPPWWQTCGQGTDSMVNGERHKSPLGGSACGMAMSGCLAQHTGKRLCQRGFSLTTVPSRRFRFPTIP